MSDFSTKGKELYEMAKELFPICRSLSGDGVRETLAQIRKMLPLLQIKEVSTDTKLFDWVVPDEWNIKDAYIEDPEGNKFAEFKKSNLNVVGYSEPVDKLINLDTLLSHVYTLPEQPEAVPYVTSYYKKNWGFCISEKEKSALKDGMYHVFIDSELKHGEINYGELILPGDTDDEIMFSTYICHPSMANDNLSGIVISAFLAQAVSYMSERRFTYRFVFIPETLGSIAYLSRNLAWLKHHVKAGFVICNAGDNNNWSIIHSRTGNTLADKALENILKFHAGSYHNYSFLKRGSDERQYCSPGVDLPFCTFCRSKFGEYAEYHTNLDDMSFISEEGLGSSLECMIKLVNALEINEKYKVNCLCEPQLGKRGLYPNTSFKGSAVSAMIIRDLIAYCDGDNDIFDISEIINVSVDKLIPLVKQLKEALLLI